MSAAAGYADEAMAIYDSLEGKLERRHCSELAASGKPSVLVPFPFAADDHQKKNAEAMEKAGAARMVLDHEMTGDRLFDEIAALATDVEGLGRLRQNVRKFSRPQAASRAADVLEEVGRKRLA